MNIALNFMKNSNDDTIASLISRSVKNAPMATRQLRVLLKLKHACKN